LTAACAASRKTGETTGKRDRAREQERSTHFVRSISEWVSHGTSITTFSAITIATPALRA
jgi:hypothetical protein